MLDSGMILLAAAAIIISKPIHDMQYAPQAAVISEVFPGSVRYTGASLGYQLASVTAGGPAPIVALYLFDRFKTAQAIAAFMAVSALVSLIAVWLLKDRSGALDDE